ncbi:MAG: DNA polymerase III subunit gamma/tau [Actinomycetia bacterium]|nr:DNA polymerase III subunit gamma/tau [Actinomycetes bacterium]
MATQSLYRRYRPGRFSEVRGQEHVIRALRNAVAEGRQGHAYLFSGPRGTGKTTLARIMAKVLNCENPEAGEPCAVCDSCVAIEEGRSFDLHELDAASNNGVEAMRDLISKANLGTPGRTKVYILDEVHMLSTGASNALLKTLEEPPDHVVFVLATTDPHKVLPTIRSRTQHLELTLLPVDQLADHVGWIIDDAQLNLGEVPIDEVIDYVIRKGGGSARDTLSALDQVVAAGGISAGGSDVDTLVEALAANDTGAALMGVAEATGSGREPRLVAEELIARLRDAFLVSLDADATLLTKTDRERAAGLAASLGAAGLTRSIETLGEAVVEMRQAPEPRIVLEVALVRLTHPQSELTLAALADRIERLERGAPAALPETPAGAPAALPETPPPAPDASDPGPARAAREALAQRGLATDKVAPTPARQSSIVPTPPPPPSAGRTLGEAKGTTPEAPSAPAVEPTTPAAADGGSGALDDGSPLPDPPPELPAEPASAPSPAPALAPVAAAPDGAGPSVDEVTAAWDDLLGALPNRGRALLLSARVVASAGGAVTFGLPNEMTAQKATEFSPDLASALSARFGGSIEVEFGTGDGPPPSSTPVPEATAPPVERAPIVPTPGPTPAPPDPAPAPPVAEAPPQPRPEPPPLVGADAPSPGPTPAADPIDDFDPDTDIGNIADLDDATDVASTHIDRLTEAFPGAEVVEPDQSPGGPS